MIAALVGHRPDMTILAYGLPYKLPYVALAIALAAF